MGKKPKDGRKWMVTAFSSYSEMETWLNNYSYIITQWQAYSSGHNHIVVIEHQSELREFSHD